VRGVVEPCSIWRGRFSLTIPRIESIRGLVGFDITEMPWRDMIQDSEFSPFKDFSLGVRRGECSLSTWWSDSYDWRDCSV
jgi:hypothetical protein